MDNTDKSVPLININIITDKMSVVEKNNRHFDKDWIISQFLLDLYSKTLIERI